MRLYKKCMEFIKRLSQDDEGISEADKAYLDKIPKQNRFGLLAMFMGGVSFTFGPVYGFLPVISLAFCMLTYKTFDKEKEDNPWPFYIGFILSLIGFLMFLGQVTHQLIV